MVCQYHSEVHSNKRQKLIPPHPALSPEGRGQGEGEKFAKDLNYPAEREQEWHPESEIHLSGQIPVFAREDFYQN